MGIDKKKVTQHIASIGIQNGKILLSPGDGMGISTLRMALSEALEMVKTQAVAHEFYRIVRQEGPVEQTKEEQIKEEGNEEKASEKGQEEGLLKTV